MRGLTGLIFFMTFYCYQCQVFSEGNCRYACDPDGSCKVSWTGPPRSGGTSASCFSPQFGGSCFGNVDGCRDCNEACRSGSSGGSSNSGNNGRPSRPSTGSSSSGCGGRPEGSDTSDPYCKYRCRKDGSGRQDGGCEVLRIGPPNFETEKGSCLPRGFCKTPSGCKDCNQAVCCNSGGSGGSGSGGSSSSSGASSSGGSKSDRNCRYECQGNGGCRVTYTGPFRPGKSSGSCFPASFGGSCSGTPPECQDCNQALSC